MYVVVGCYQCGRFLLARTNQKTRSCPYCETRLVLDKTKKLAYVKTAQEASQFLRALKREKGVERE
jgi:DNA-directed RNA polymerase subunit RPC12/RpoP